MPSQTEQQRDLWDSAGASPIRTEQGWLEIYHGANTEHQYCLSAFLMDLNDPSKVIARTTNPIMVPTETYELSGFLDTWFLPTDTL